MLAAKSPNMQGLHEIGNTMHLAGIMSYVFSPLPYTTLDKDSVTTLTIINNNNAQGARNGGFGE